MQTRPSVRRGRRPAAVSLLSSLPLLAALLAGSATPARAADVTISSPWTGAVPIFVNSGDTLTITGNGSVSNPSGSAIWVNGGTLIIEDGSVSGQITPTVIVQSGTATISGGTVTGTGAAVHLQTGATVSISDDATLTGSGIGSTAVTVAGGTANIIGGTLAGDVTVLQGGGTVTISGGSISGTTRGVWLMGGTMSISGCLELSSSGRLTGTLEHGQPIDTATTGLTAANLQNLSTCDTAAPTTTATANAGSDPYTDGTWTNQTVSVVLNATDLGGSGTKEIVYSATGAQPIASTTVSGAAASFTITAEGTTTISFHAVDNAGNVEQPDQTFVVKIDQTAPSLTLPLSPVTGTATSTAGALVTFLLDASDSGSGLAGTPSATPASGSLFSPGLTTVNATATDNAGNTATGSFTVHVTYAWSGVLQPINADGYSVFKAGSTIPVRFQLTGASAGITDLAATLSVAKISDNVAGTEFQAVSTSAASTGNRFRYDATSGQYLFNWGTKGLSSGTYQLRIDLGDGVSHAVQVSLK